MRNARSICQFAIAATALAHAGCASEVNDDEIANEADAVTASGLATTVMFDQPESGWSGYTANLADVNGDGRADLVWNQLGTINRTYVNLSNGNGTFRRALTAFDQPEQGWNGFTLTTADVDGDGRADLVWNEIGTINRTYVDLSNGDGTFRRALTAFDQPERGWSGYRLVVADVNGDGRADLVWNQLATLNRTYVDLSNGDGTFRRALTAFDQPLTQSWRGYAPHLADVNGDGLADLVWTQVAANNRTAVELSNGDGTFRSPLTAFDQPEGPWSGYVVRLADVNGDGMVDLVWNQAGTINRTYVNLSNGDGTFRRALTAFDQPEGGSWSFYATVTADVNGDGMADLVWNQLGTINRTYIDLASGNGTFRRAVTALDQPQSNWSGFRMLVGDVSGDGRADIVWNQLDAINRTYVSLSEL